MHRKTKDFKFKQFTITGGNSGMPVSTDGVLLGAWANIQDATSILDIGTGTGLLALMCAQRNAQTNILAIDIDDEAIKSARHNINSSPWKKRIKVVQKNILTLESDTKYQHIICNPPYFNSGEQSQNRARAIARHTDSLPHTDLLEACKLLLTQNGSANFILPKVEGDQFIDIAQEKNWHLSRLCQIKTTANKPISRYLIEIKQKQNQSQLEQSQLQIHQNAQYSQQFITLTQDFYLKM